MNKYVNHDGTLKDNKVLEDLNKAGNMYRQGELLETHDLLLEIVKQLKSLKITTNLIRNTKVFGE